MLEVSVLNLSILLSVMISLAIIIILIYAYTGTRKPNVKRYDSERKYIDPANDNKVLEFPSLEDPPTKELSVIIPAYNEEKRLPKMIEEAMEYLNKKFANADEKSGFEIIVVDDGSSDKTTNIARSYSKKYGTDKFRVLTLVENRGKGGAIRMGAFVSRGRYILFADADGATKFSDIQKLDKLIREIQTKHKEEMAIACGSRAHLEKEAIASRSFFRTILMKGFHLIVWLFCVKSIKDTQCGFKLLTRPAASVLFRIMHVDRWAFDVDLLHVAEQLRIPIDEVPVTWTEIEGSKIVPIFSWLQMGKDIVAIRLRYSLGVWKILPIDFNEIRRRS
ncbi:DgyrCDS3629 [Dimorphilus gyrociliatus]|uniref:Dolichyl-phosphate beta-glucosyltransferase n=1 Tax=Dimorphilus gyrociliatus TaxID=2664684 RepID=A0A7I8VED2_9ANNE|nr:DgyrCDS3629 [Dimorphilus gyrociliatus]